MILNEFNSMIDDIIESFEEENTKIMLEKYSKKIKDLMSIIKRLENLSLNFLTHIIVKI